MYRNFCQAVLPLLFQVFYNFTIFFCVYARKRTFCVFIHKKRGKIVLLRKFLHKKNNKPEGKNTTAQRRKTPSFSPARRNAGMPLSDFSPRVRRPVRRKANDAHGLFLLYFCPSLFSPFPPTARPCPTDLPFSFFLFVLCFCLFFSHASGIFALGARWRGNIVLPSRSKKLSPFNKQDPDFKKPFVPCLQTFSFGKNPHRFHDRRKKGGYLLPPFRP